MFKNEWAGIIDAQRATLDVRAKIIDEVIEENARLKSVISRQTTEITNLYRETKRLRMILGEISEDFLAKQAQV